MNAEQIEEIRKRAEAAKEFGNDVGKLAMDDAPALLAEVERLQKELEWYADMANYTANETSCDGLPAIDNDYGRRARRALGLKGADE